MLNGEIWN